MARGGGKYRIEGVFAWMCLFIPLQIFKAFRRNQMLESEQERKERIFAANNPTVPKGTAYLTCPRCGSQNYDPKTRLQFVFADIGPEHFCSEGCQKAFHQKSK